MRVAVAEVLPCLAVVAVVAVALGGCQRVDPERLRAVERRDRVTLRPDIEGRFLNDPAEGSQSNLPTTTLFGMLTEAEGGAWDDVAVEVRHLRDGDFRVDLSDSSGRVLRRRTVRMVLRDGAWQRKSSRITGVFPLLWGTEDRQYAFATATADGRRYIYVVGERYAGASIGPLGLAAGGSRSIDRFAELDPAAAPGRP